MNSLPDCIDEPFERFLAVSSKIGGRGCELFGRFGVRDTIDEANAKGESGPMPAWLSGEQPADLELLLASSIGHNSNSQFNYARRNAPSIVFRQPFDTMS